MIKYAVKYNLGQSRGFVLQDNNPKRVKVFEKKDEADIVAAKFYGKAEVVEWKQ